MTNFGRLCKGLLPSVTVMRDIGDFAALRE